MQLLWVKPGLRPDLERRCVLARVCPGKEVHPPLWPDLLGGFQRRGLQGCWLGLGLRGWRSERRSQPVSLSLQVMGTPKKAARSSTAPTWRRGRNTMGRTWRCLRSAGGAGGGGRSKGPGLQKLLPLTRTGPWVARAAHPGLHEGRLAGQGKLRPQEPRWCGWQGQKGKDPPPRAATSPPLPLLP